MNNTLYVVLILLLAALVPPAFAADNPHIGGEGELVAPVYRFDTYFGDGAKFIESLPDETRIMVNKADGGRYELKVHEGKLNTVLADTKIEAEGNQLVTPMGYVLHVGPEDPPALTIVAPFGGGSLFRVRAKSLTVFEDDGGGWVGTPSGPPLRLPDGSRIDFLDDYQVVEVLTLNGERFRREIGKGPWVELDRLPSPPLIPNLETHYLAGDGNDWRKPGHEEHLIFAWSWYPYGLALPRVIKDLQKTHRKEDLFHFFKNIDRRPPAAESAGYLLARRLALGGGDWLTLELPEQEPRVVFVLPGALEPDFFMPRPLERFPEIKLR